MNWLKLSCYYYMIWFIIASSVPKSKYTGFIPCMHVPIIFEADSQECLNDCDQVCSNTTGSFQCSCIDGYTLSSNGQSCQDINECTPGTYDHGCQQQCMNINGGYFCDCHSGHQLNSDGRYCTSEHEHTLIIV